MRHKTFSSERRKIFNPHLCNCVTFFLFFCFLIYLYQNISRQAVLDHEGIRHLGKPSPIFPLFYHHCPKKKKKKTKKQNCSNNQRKNQMKTESRRGEVTGNLHSKIRKPHAKKRKEKKKMFEQPVEKPDENGKY